MNGRSRLLAFLAILAVLAASCGGGDTSSDDGTGDSDNPAGQDRSPGSGDGAQDSDGDSSETDGSNSSGGDVGSGPPELDPGSMPPAGEVVFEVDGQTFTIVADQMDYFICDIGDEFVNVRSESATQDLTVQFDPASGRGNATVTPDGSDVAYNSFFGPETTGGVAVEAPHLLYEAPFDASQLDNLSDISQVGVGRISVTCP